MNCDMPNEILDFWEGQCIMEKVKSELMLANIKNLLLRGCFVRNTEYGIGVVLYTGMDSKIMRNLKKAPRKVSNVMKLMNKMLYTVFAFQIGLIIVFGGLSINWMKLNTTNSAYLNLVRFFNIIFIQSGSTNYGGIFFVQVLTFWVAYSHMIPISLYVIIEMLKLG